jgi:hypothetical protein
MIIIHLNDEMYNELIDYKNENVIINNIYYSKNKFSFDITKAHFENFNLLINLNKSFNNFIFLASNCYFLRNINNYDILSIDLLDKPLKNKIISFDFENIKNWYFYKNVLKNKKIINLFQLNEIEIRNGQIEGRCISYNIMMLIYNFIIVNNIEKIIENLFPFEEMIIPSLQYYFSKNDTSNIICKVFWNNKNYYPSIKDIDDVIKNELDIFCIKRINRNKNCIIKNYIDNI